MLFRSTFRFHALEKEMATHSSVLAWRIPGMGEPGGLPSVGARGAGGGARPGVRVPTPSVTALELAHEGSRADARPLTKPEEAAGTGWGAGKSVRGGGALGCCHLPGSGEGMGAKPTLRSGLPQGAQNPRERAETWSPGGGCPPSGGRAGGQRPEGRAEPTGRV